MEALLRDADTVAPDMVKLRLFELLNAKMIQMELRLLGNTERLGTKATAPYGAHAVGRPNSVCKTGTHDIYISLIITLLLLSACYCIARAQAFRRCRGCPRSWR